MAPYAFTLTWDAPWRGGREEFSNVFHYDVPFGGDGVADLTSVLDQLAAAMRPLHGSALNLLRGRVNGPTDQGKIANIMVVAKDYNQAGTALTGGLMPPEMAVVVSQYVGRGPQGGKQVLRKYIHGRTLLGASQGGGQERGELALSTTSKDQYTNAFNALNNVFSGGIQYSICTDKGKHIPLNSSWKTNDFVRTRQFKRGRKEKNPA